VGYAFPASEGRGKGEGEKVSGTFSRREYDSELVTGEKFGPQLQAAGVVHGEYIHGGAADGRDPHDAHTTEQKVLSPRVASGVEERHQITAKAIHAREVRSLAKITAVAGQREIVNVIAPAVLFGDDMLDVMR